MSTDDAKYEATIPTRFRARCEFCHFTVDTRLSGVYQWTAGWVMQREGGGGHAVSLPERSNRFAHGHCIDRQAQGNPQQRKLF
jgi:hypothetical protein